MVKSNVISTLQLIIGNNKIECYQTPLNHKLMMKQCLSGSRVNSKGPKIIFAVRSINSALKTYAVCVQNT
jgi:hypothetical protein